MAPRRRCPTCGSKQWHKEPSSGLIACSEGHVLQNYRNETTEMDEVGPHSMKKRTLKSQKKKKENESRADPKLYHGVRGRYHYFLCLQLILRHQIVALTKLWELPPEFEVICKDLWALHLTLLPDPPPAEPYLHAQENQEGDEDIADIKQSLVDEEVNDEDLENELELDALMQENSDISDSSDEEGNNLIPSDNKKPSKSRGRIAYERPVSTIAVLVVGCWTLRIPVMYRDFSRMIEMYKLPYLEAVELLPESMVLHLTKHNTQALSPHHAPSTLTMHSLASRLAKKMYSSFGVYTPELNASSILWRITKDMGGTPMLYMLSKRLANVLSIPLTLHWSLALGLSKRRRSDPHRHQLDGAPAEVALLAAVMIVLKMIYGMDGNERQPKDKGDVAWALPSGHKVMEGMMDRDVKFDSDIDLKVGDMSSRALDEYMKFCGKVLPGQTKTQGWIVMEEEEEKGEEEEEIEKIRVGSGIESRGEEKGLPGSNYNILNGRDVCGIVDEEYERVLSVGGKVVGVSVQYLGVVMERFERQLITAGAES